MTDENGGTKDPHSGVVCCGVLENLAAERPIPFEKLAEMYADRGGVYLPTGKTTWVVWTYVQNGETDPETKIPVVDSNSRKFVPLKYCPFCGVRLTVPDYLTEGDE